MQRNLFWTFPRLLLQRWRILNEDQPCQEEEEKKCRRWRWFICQEIFWQIDGLRAAASQMVSVPSVRDTGTHGDLSVVLEQNRFNYWSICFTFSVLHWSLLIKVQLAVAPSPHLAIYGLPFSERHFKFISLIINFPIYEPSSALFF